jgi:hypothetical protein
MQRVLNSAVTWRAGKEPRAEHECCRCSLMIKSDFSVRLPPVLLDSGLSPRGWLHPPQDCLSHACPLPAELQTVFLAVLNLIALRGSCRLCRLIFLLVFPGIAPAKL